QVARVYMGRSFGVLPANRGIVSKGPFRWVRHPIYFGWLILSIGYAMSCPNDRNIILIATTFPFMVWRIGQEEVHLSADPAYRRYMDRVRYRLWPGVVWAGVAPGRGRGVALFRRRASFSAAAAARTHQVDSPCQRSRKNHRESESADHRDCQRLLNLGARAEAEREREQARSGGERGHDDRAQPHGRRIEQRRAWLCARADFTLGMVEQQDAVLCGYSRDHDDSHER